MLIHLLESLKDGENKKYGCCVWYLQNVERISRFYGQCLYVRYIYSLRSPARRLLKAIRITFKSSNRVQNSMPKVTWIQICFGHFLTSISGDSIFRNEEQACSLSPSLCCFYLLIGQPLLWSRPIRLSTIFGLHGCAILSLPLVCRALDLSLSF